MKNLFKLFLPFVIVLAAIVAGVRFGSTYGVLAGVAIGCLALNMMAGPLLLTWRGQCLGDNVLPSGLNLDVVLDSALVAFRETILPVTAFATVFRDVILRGTNKISVPYFPLATSASRDFDGTYVFDGTETQLRDVTVNKRKYQSLAFTSAELARLPALNAEELGALKGRKLAEDVISDILSIVTLANYGAHIWAGAASAFDTDDVADIRTALNVANWPKVGRSLILDSAYDGALVKDDPLLHAEKSGSAEQLRSGMVRPFMGFDKYFDTNSIPANGETLVGMAAYQSAILVAFSPIEPAEEVRKNMSDYRAVTEEEGGLTLEYRAWGDPDSDTAKRVIECNYGYDQGEANAIKRIVTTAP